MFPAVIRRGGGVQATPFSSPLLGFNLSQGGESQLPSPWGGLKGGREREGVGGLDDYLHLCPGRWGDPRYLQKTQACPAHSLPLNEKSWGGVERDFTRKGRRRKWTGRILHYSIICTSLFPLVFIFEQMCTGMHVWKIRGGYSVETLHGFRISSMVASRPPVSWYVH